MPRDAVSRTANVERTGRHKWVNYHLLGNSEERTKINLLLESTRAILRKNWKLLHPQYANQKLDFHVHHMSFSVLSAPVGMGIVIHIYILIYMYIIFWIAIVEILGEDVAAVNALYSRIIHKHCIISITTRILYCIIECVMNKFHEYYTNMHIYFVLLFLN